MRNQLFYFFILSIVVFGAQGCQQTTIKRYTLDNAFLAEEVIDPRTGIALRPPLQWDEVNIPNVAAYNQSLSEVSPYKVSVNKMFINQNTSGIILISDISSISQETMTALPRAYNDLLNSRSQWNSISHAEVEINGNIADEYLMKSNNMVNYKLLFLSGEKPPFQVDYLIPQSFYDELMQSKIEASIASIVNQ